MALVYAYDDVRSDVFDTPLHEGIVAFMHRLPDIEDPEELRRIIIKQCPIIAFTDQLRILIFQNIAKMQENAQKDLYALIYSISMNQNG